MTRPNVLWICTDQQRWDTINALGATAAQTPNLDRLVAEGTAFTRAYCQSPICTPSRASFLTGMYPIAHQVHRNGNIGFPDHLTLLPQVFREAGYRTGLIGKLHLSAAQSQVEKRPTSDGYDEFYWSQHPGSEWPEGHDYANWLAEHGINVSVFDANHDPVSHPVGAEHSQVSWATDRATNFIRRGGNGQPWLLSINIYDPHPPFDPPESWYRRFDPAEMPLPVFAPGDLSVHAALSGVDQQTRNPRDPLAAPDAFAPANGTHDTPPDSYDIREIRAAYFAMIAMVDEMVGRLTAILDETGQRRDTLVVFMSDHGEMLGDHGLLYKGCRFYDGLVRVPLILSQPGRVAEGLVSDALVELVDLPTTLYDAVGLSAPAQDQGLSLWPIIAEDADPSHHKDHVLSEYFDALGFPGSVGSRGTMYFDGRYKLAVYHDAARGELYDSASDPYELNNLWNDPGRADLKATLIARHFTAMMLASGTGPARVADY